MAESTVKITITDDFLFGTIMRHKEFCKPLLETILGIKIRDLNYINEQALDAEVNAYNADEKWRMDRMMLMEAYATHEDIGEYRGIVKAIRRRLQRNPSRLDAEYAEDHEITEAKMEEVVQTIQNHPDWDDMKIACEVTWDE